MKIVGCIATNLMFCGLLMNYMILPHFNPALRGNKWVESIPLRRVGSCWSENSYRLAGHRIRGFANDPNPRLKPLGFSPFEPGFGSLFVTFRNCPNNSPLALWYGDPYSYPENHPLAARLRIDRLAVSVSRDYPATTVLAGCG